MTTRKTRRYTIEQFINSEGIRDNSIAHDDSSILYSSDRTGIYNAYSVSVDGGEAEQLTASETESIFSLSFFPRDKRILYHSDRGGNELMHIYLRDEQGKVTDLTPGDKVRTEFYGWSHDDSCFFFGSNARDPQCTDILRCYADTLETEIIFDDDGSNRFGAVSPDQRFLAMVKPNVSTDSDIWLYDLSSGQGRNLTAHQGEIRNYALCFSPHGEFLYYLTDKGSEYMWLCRYCLKEDKHEKLLGTGWDIVSATFSKTGRYMVVAINNDSRTEVRVYDNSTGKLLEMPKLPQGDITNLVVSPSEKLLSFYVSGSRNPANLWVYDLGTGVARQLTDTLNKDIDSDDLVEAEVVRYPARDGLEIPAVYYKPLDAGKDNTVPALVWVHGGPGGQSRVGYNPLLQYLANHGYAIIAVNNRGSSGYGKTFFSMADKKHGEADLADCIDSKDYLKSTGYIDGEKIGIIGGSYGGYMVLAAMAFTPEEFTVGVDIFGVSNWVRTLASIPPWWESMRHALYTKIGNPETEEEYLRRISPLFHAANINRPLLVLQGENDPRVLKVESDEIVEAVRANGVPVEYVVFDDEGHGFSKKANQIRGFSAVRDFLDLYLK